MIQSLPCLFFFFLHRHFRLLLESQKSELAAGAAQVDELLRSVDGLKLELSTAKDQLVQFQTSLIPDLQKKLQVSDEQLRYEYEK